MARLPVPAGTARRSCARQITGPAWGPCPGERFHIEAGPPPSKLLAGHELLRPHRLQRQSSRYCMHGNRDCVLAMAASLGCVQSRILGWPGASTQSESSALPDRRTGCQYSKMAQRRIVLGTDFLIRKRNSTDDARNRAGGCLQQPGRQKARTVARARPVPRCKTGKRPALRRCAKVASPRDLALFFAGDAKKAPGARIRSGHAQGPKARRLAFHGLKVDCINCRPRFSGESILGPGALGSLLARGGAEVSFAESRLLFLLAGAASSAHGWTSQATSTPHA